MTDDDNNWLNRNSPFLVLFLVCLAITGMCYYFYVGIKTEPNGVPAEPMRHLEQLANKGDMFGALTSWFTGLAFAGLITTLMMQRNDLNLQKKELRETRKVFIAQKNQMELQAFESTFFHMLDVFNKYIEAISIDYLGQLTTGRNAIPLILSAKVSTVDHLHQLCRVEKHRAYLKKTLSLHNLDDQLEKIQTLEAEHIAISRSYFRVLANLVELVDSSSYFAPLTAAEAKLEKRKYTDIIRAQLSEAEVGLLLIHFHSNSSHKNWPRYIKDYKLLEFGPKEYPNGSDRAGMIQQCRYHRRPD